MKYLFLDIDGVLNHENWYKATEHNKPINWWEEDFDPECVRRLNEILKETSARLVVSSSWRFDEKLPMYFEDLGITTDYDSTPNLNGISGHVDRGEEIAKFLEDHPCDSYVILDDDVDFTEEQMNGHFVHCCCDYTQALLECHPMETGLTDLKMKEAIRILNSD
jgi:hypothetical protein